MATTTKVSERKRRVMGKTQNALLRAHLTAGNSISPMEALTVFGITRLAARIHDLANTGMRITRTDRVDAKGQRYTRYRKTRA